jgi:NAD(P)-dependent dehydrogenase (short-subunit alcohol dehydrogenase family)
MWVLFGHRLPWYSPSPVSASGISRVGRVGTPGDIAGAIGALIGNGHVTGTLLPVDGGQRLV